MCGNVSTRYAGEDNDLQENHRVRLDWLSALGAWRVSNSDSSRLSRCPWENRMQKSSNSIARCLWTRVAHGYGYIDFRHWHSTWAFNTNIQHWHSTLAFNFDIQHWQAKLAFNIGIQHWHATLAFDIGIQHWHSIVAFNTDLQH